MSNSTRKAQLVEVTKISKSIDRKRFAWIVVERNEGARLASQLEKMCKFKQGLDIIVVDGNSSDGTRELLLGGTIDIDTLLAKKGYLGVITSDGNGKDSVEDVQKFIDLLNEGNDFIQGSRFLENGNHLNTPLLRYLGIRFVSSPYTSLVAGIKITDSTNGFRAYSKRLIESDLLRLDLRFFRGYSLVSFVPLFVGRNNMKFAEVSVRRDYPSSGATPTKIVSPAQWMQIFFDLFRATFETYPDYGDENWLDFSES